MTKTLLKSEMIILQISHLNFGKLSFSTVQIFAKTLPLKKIRKSLHFSQILMHNVAISLWGKGVVSQYTISLPLLIF